MSSEGARWRVARCVLVLWAFACATPGGLQIREALAEEETAQTHHVECEHAKLNTDDATPVDPGGFELELAYTLSHARRQYDNRWGRRSRSLTQEHGFEVGLTYGVVDNLDVGVGFGFADLYDRDEPARFGRGLADLSVGTKWRFYHDEERALSLAYLSGLTIPVGRRTDSSSLGPSQQYWSLDQKLAMSKDWSPWTMNADLGYSLPFGDDTDGARGSAGFNVALGYQLNDWLQPELELNYAHDFLSGGSDSDTIALTGGFIICLSENMRLDVGVQRVMAGRNTDAGTSAIVALVYAW